MSEVPGRGCFGFGWAGWVGGVPGRAAGFLAGAGVTPPDVSGVPAGWSGFGFGFGLLCPVWDPNKAAIAANPRPEFVDIGSTPLG
jgi:hypothetical protein